MIADVAASIWCGSMNPNTGERASAHAPKTATSSDGTPRSVHITSIATSENACIRSPPPSAARPSRRSFTTRAANGRNDSTERGENAFDTSLRKRSCFGPSFVNIRSPYHSRSAPSVMPMRSKKDRPTPATRSSLASALTSACLRKIVAPVRSSLTVGPSEARARYIRCRSSPIAAARSITRLSSQDGCVHRRRRPDAGRSLRRCARVGPSRRPRGRRGEGPRRAARCPRSGAHRRRVSRRCERGR